MEKSEILYMQSMIQNPKKKQSPNYIKQIQSYLRQVRFFQNLIKDISIDEYIACCKLLKCKTFYPGEMIWDESPLEKVYIIIKGSVVFKDFDDHIIRVYNEGSFFGDNLITKKRPKDFRIFSTTNSTIGYYDIKDYKIFLLKHLEEKKIALVNFLHAQKHFLSWKKGQIMELSYYLTETVCDKGECLFNQNDPSEHLYIIIEGEMILFEYIARRLTNGDIIGLDDIIEDKARSFSCVASCKSLLLTLSKYDFIHVKEFFNIKTCINPIAQRYINTVNLFDSRKIRESTAPIGLKNRIHRFIHCKNTSDIKVPSFPIDNSTYKVQKFSVSFLYKKRATPKISRSQFSMKSFSNNTEITNHKPLIRYQSFAR